MAENLKKRRSKVIPLNPLVSRKRYRAYNDDDSLEQEENEAKIRKLIQSSSLQ